MAILSFRNKSSEEIHQGVITKKSLKLLPQNLHELCRIKFAKLGAATSLSDLQSLRGNRLEVLKGNRQGQLSIRINDQYRICFIWKDKNAEMVEVTDYH